MFFKPSAAALASMRLLPAARDISGGRVECLLLLLRPTDGATTRRHLLSLGSPLSQLVGRSLGGLFET